MIWQNYRLGSNISKVTGTIILWKTEKGIVEIGKDALAIPIMLDNEQRGFIFHGQGRLILDTIVETEKGAVGKPEDKEVEEPFLMLGPINGVQQHLIEADNEDCEKTGYENEKAFMVEAEKLCTQFFRKIGIRGNSCDHEHGIIFAFPNKSSKLDVLIAHNNKLIYRSTDKVFLSHNGKTILKTPEQVVLTGSRKLCILKKGCC